MNMPKVFVARLLGLDVFDPLGDRLGRMRDAVVVDRGPSKPAQCVGLLVEVPGKKRVFVPMTRVQSIDSVQIICSGLVNLRRFQQRGVETLVAAELFDRQVTFRDGSGAGIVEDIGLERQRSGDWVLSDFYVRRGDPSAFGFRALRRGERILASWDEISAQGHSNPQGATNFIEAHEEMKAADFADALHEMSDKRRVEVAQELQDDRLADILQELPDEEQVQILESLEIERAADVLEEMDPDDAADLLAELPEHQQEALLELMEPEEAEDVRRLLEYEENTAGSMMTPVPIILPPEATVAEALAYVRREEVSPALASSVYVCRPPLETPTGKYLGVVHTQALLRWPPPEALGKIVDKDLEPISDQADVSEVARMLATYNLTAAPVVSQDGRLVGAVTVDDVLDHLLPDDWRTRDDDDVERPKTKASSPLLRLNPLNAKKGGARRG
ncbi:magnesium transporter MgtE N-terminal domain-containing protein [Neomicrococcus aestuarii]|uniref:Magnesium transporter n=1 Tax=Neomicrococcus aestuarii TaxID=556325 RepID=A0A1L2ZQ75_9MICC|nr:CBS domain-containing protein [Neomicrococcus aestuarii]APF41593.1 magnesium transporter [Neomicrococcus aestuarii]